MRRYLAMTSVALAALVASPVSGRAAESGLPLEQPQQFVEAAVREISANWSDKPIWDHAVTDLSDYQSRPQIRREMDAAASELGRFVAYRWADGRVTGQGAESLAIYKATAIFENGAAVFEFVLHRQGGLWAIANFHVRAEPGCLSEQHRDPFKPVSPAEANPGPADLTIAPQLVAGERANQNGDFVAAILFLKGPFHSSRYDEFSPVTRYRLDAAYGLAAMRTGQLQDAYQAYLRATELPNAPADAWISRMQVAELTSDFDDGYIAFKGFQAICQNTFTLNEDQVRAFDDGFGALGDVPEAQLEFEQYLEKTGWQSPDPAWSLDPVHFHYAQNLLAAGKTEKALQIASAISDPGILVVLAADKRFDAIRVTGDANALVIKSANEKLAKFRQMAKQDPNSIGVQRVTAGMLDLLGKPEEALATITAALGDAGRVRPGERRDRYNFGPQYDRAIAMKAQLLFELGHYDEATAIASALPGGGQIDRPDTDKSLVVAGWLIALGRGPEALALLQSVAGENLSFKGRARAAEYRACAAAQTGDHEVFRQSVQYLMEHRAYDVAGLLHAYLCADDPDHAAGAVVGALNDAHDRAEILRELQIYRRWNTEPAFAKTIAERLDRVRSSPNVRSAIDRVGRVNRYEIQFPNDLLWD